jgi:ATP-binding cassette, subfamily B, bacterial MsbA
VSTSTPAAQSPLASSPVKTPVASTVGSTPNVTVEHPEKHRDVGQPLAAAPSSRQLFERHFREWVLPRWRGALGVMLLTIMVALTSSSYPLIIKYAADSVEKRNANALPIILILVVAIAAAKGLFMYLQIVQSSSFIQRMTTDIQRKVFDHVIAADFAVATRTAPGQLLSKLFNDIGNLQMATQTVIGTAFRDVLTLVGYVGSMFYLNWQLMLIVMMIYPIAILPITSVSQRLHRVAKETQSQLGSMMSLITEQLASPRLIKTFGLERYATDKVNASFENVLKLQLKGIRSKARLEPILEALGGLAVAGVGLFAYWQISGGRATAGDFAGFLSALLFAAQPVRALGRLSGKLQEGRAGAESIYALLDEVPRVTDRPGAKPLLIKDGTITFDKVSFSYETAESTNTINGVSLVVPGHKTVALVGRSGAGKSTMINLVPRLFDVTAGRILIDGQAINDVTLASLRGQISIVSQDVTLFDDTIRANIALGRLNATDADICAAATAAAAHDFILAQPNGYDTGIGDRGQRLSGGQRQRIALARAILKDAPILLLDEATSALDTESEKLVQDALSQFTRDRTTLVIAHRLSTIQNADLICVMEDGGIIEIGTHAELFAKGGNYTNLCRQQFLGGG